MGFSAKQVQALRRNPDRRHIRTREAHGRELTYLEGWYAISEANRIFGFDGWIRRDHRIQMRPGPGEPGHLPGGLHRPGAGHRAGGWGNHYSGGPWHRRRPRHLSRRGARHRPQGGGDRCHQAGAGDLRQAVRS